MAANAFSIVGEQRFFFPYSIAPKQIQKTETKNTGKYPAKSLTA
jgi:hypothetical protein